MSDEHLVDYVRRGDEAAFEVLYDRHHKPVLSFCRHMLRSADEAEDAVQHAFIAAYNDLSRGGERDIHFKAWIYTIARNRCLSMLRARREQASDEIEITTDRLGEDVQQRADLQSLVADIQELPEDQREALVLSEVGDLSHLEVARIIGCEASKVKSLVFQARTSLIERRQARETPCEEIREQLATLRGGALRRSHLRHHLAACPGCTQYREEIKRQRQMLALALPVIPSLGLRESVLAAVGIGGGAGGAGGMGIGLGLAAKSTLAKVGVAALVAGAGAGTTVVATHGGLPDIGGKSGKGGSLVTPAAASPAAENVDGGSGAAGATGGSHDSATDAKKAHERSASGTEHGFTPTKRESNGDRARQFAATRGNGKHKGILKSHHTKTHARRVHTRHRHTTVKVAPVPRRRTTTPTTAPTTRATQPKTESSPTSTTERTATSTTPVPSPDSGNGGGGGGKGKGGAAGLALP